MNVSSVSRSVSEQVGMDLKFSPTAGGNILLRVSKVCAFTALLFSRGGVGLSHKQKWEENAKNDHLQKYIGCLEEQGVYTFDYNDKYAPADIKVDGAFLDLQLEKPLERVGYNPVASVNNSNLFSYPKIQKLTERVQTVVEERMGESFEFNRLNLKVTKSEPNYYPHLDGWPKVNLNWLSVVFTVDSKDTPEAIIPKENRTYAKTTEYVPGLISTHKPFHEVNPVFMSDLKRFAVVDCERNHLGDLDLAPYMRAAETNQLVFIDYNVHSRPVDLEHYWKGEDHRLFAQYFFTKKGSP